MTEPGVAIVPPGMTAVHIPTKVPASPLAAALAAVQADLPRLGKDEVGKVSGQKDGKFYSYEYSYADLASVSRAILPLLGRHGLAFAAFPTVTEGRLVLRYYLMHEAGEKLTGDYPLSGSTAQQQGSSITYARRYCLCAVTGIAPDEDDDGARAAGEQEQERHNARQEQVAADSQEYTHAAAAVQGAWANHVGEWDAAAAGKAFHTWSRGGVLREADAPSLRSFAQWLTDQPLKDAGTAPPAHEPPSDDEPVQTYRGSRTPEGPMTQKQRGALFAMLGELGLTNQVDQLQWVNQQLGTEYESRTQITAGNADLLITALKAGDVPATSERAE